MKTLDKAKLPTDVIKPIKKHSIYDIGINALDGKPISLKDFKGKKLLFVNVASACGFTKQYKELQALSNTYADKLVVIGSPCNQFGKQEPGNASEIQEFCDLNFGVTFLLTEKIDVKGSKQHPLYIPMAYLKRIKRQEEFECKMEFSKISGERERRSDRLLLFHHKTNEFKNNQTLIMSIQLIQLLFGFGELV